MTIYYLYKKTHTKTGISYLGQTTKDPHKYNGSGVDWKQHLKEHGSEFVETQILAECKTRTELYLKGKMYSDLWDVVNNNNWANRIPETGGGGASPNAGIHMRLPEYKERMLGENNMAKRPDVRQKLSQASKGIPKSESHKKNMCKPMQIPEVAAKRRGEGNWGYDHRIFTFEHKDGRVEICTPYQLRTKYALNKGNLTTVINHPDKAKSISGWRVITRP